MIGDLKRPVNTTMARSVVDLCRMVRERDARIQELESMCSVYQTLWNTLIETDAHLAQRIMRGEEKPCQENM